MQECKNRAPGSLEWKDETSSSFETYAEKHLYDLDKYNDGEYRSGSTQAAVRAWNARQPEIDALKSDNGGLSLAVSLLQAEIARLKAENEKLREADQEVEVALGYLAEAMTAPDTKGE